MTKKSVLIVTTFVLILGASSTLRAQNTLPATMARTVASVRGEGPGLLYSRRDCFAKVTLTVALSKLMTAEEYRKVGFNVAWRLYDSKQNRFITDWANSKILNHTYEVDSILIQSEIPKSQIPHVIYGVSAENLNVVISFEGSPLTFMLPLLPSNVMDASESPSEPVCPPIRVAGGNT